jgi:hypothetical protein
MFKSASKRYWVILLLILLLSAGLRFGLVRYNRDSNDNHDLVIIRIMETGVLPEKDDCWECFQPKLFHYTTARLLQLAGVDPENVDKRVNLGAGLINFLAGLLTLIVVALVITRIPSVGETLKLVAFGLVALNPDLIGISSQATNDAFAILFSTLAIFFTILCLEQRKFWKILLVVIFTVLGISSKTNLWVTAVAITLALLVQACVEKKEVLRKVAVSLAFLVAVTGLSILNPLNQYITNTEKYGSPVLVNVEREPLPALITKTESSHPGLLSIADGIFTFRYFDLIRHPLIQNGDSYTPNRTSLWAQIYGRAHSIHFPNWPGTWSAKAEEGSNLTRTLFIFALPPTLLLVFGALLEMINTVKTMVKPDATLASKNTYGFLSMLFIGYLLFLVLYTILYRNFSVMKAIFIYPVLPAFPIFFIRGMEWFIARIIRSAKIVRGFAITWITVLFVLYAVDVATMIQLIYSRVTLK